MVVADDNEGEWGKQNWEEKSAGYIEKGHIPISMKNDFAKIYPDRITKAAEQYVPADVPAAAEQGEAEALPDAA